MKHSPIKTVGLCAITAWLLMAAGCQIPKEPVPPMSKYVRVEKQDGRYWFVHGSNRFLSLGVNVVQPADGSETPDGRVYNVLSKYDHNDAAWADDAAKRLTDWGFTTVGAWSHEYLYQHVPMYHSRVVWFGEWGQHDSRLIDVFAPSYAEAIDRVAREHVAPHATNEYLIGYFANNELPWYGERGWPTSPHISLLTRYMQLPEKAPGKIRLIDFLRAHYANDFAALSEEWTVDADSFDALLKARRITPKTRPSRRAVVAWSGIVADRYFKLCADAIRAHDPNHLFLGSRFAERAQEPVMAACGKYADVISLNHYRRTGVPDIAQIGAISALCGKPVMITEFSSRAMENSSGCPNSKGADVTVATQADRAKAYRTYTTSVLAQPYIVGFDWFMYHDQPPAGRFDGEDSNYGLVDIQDRLYTELLSAVVEVNGKAMQLHEQSDTPAPVYHPDILADYRELTLRGSDKKLEKPVVFADTHSSFDIWGDFASGAKLETRESTPNILLLDVDPGSGWGCGITFHPTPGLAANTDGSIDLQGGRQVRIRIKAPQELRIGLGFNESGVGPVDSQTFAGFGHADGEAYAHGDKVLSPTADSLCFLLLEMEPGAQYGNQRGNKCIDMDAITSIHLFFPGGQSPFTADFMDISIE